MVTDKICYGYHAVLLSWLHPCLGEWKECPRPDFIEDPSRGASTQLALVKSRQAARPLGIIVKLFSDM